VTLRFHSDEFMVFCPELRGYLQGSAIGSRPEIDKIHLQQCEFVAYVLTASDNGT